MSLTKEQQRMAWWLNLDPATDKPAVVKTIDEMIAYRAEHGEESFRREVSARFAAPAPTLYSIDRKLNEIARSVRSLGEALADGRRK